MSHNRRTVVIAHPLRIPIRGAVHVRGNRVAHHWQLFDHHLRPSVYVRAYDDDDDDDDRVDE